jgi:hypothetical protein
MRCGAIWIAFLLLGCELFGVPVRQARPCAPLDDFFMPVFNGQGVKVWDVRGTDALISTVNDIVKLRNVYVQLAGENVGAKPKMVLGSPEAFLDGHGQCIYGEEFVHIAGELFTVMGARWKFQRDDNQITLDREVRVFFEVDLARELEGDTGKSFDAGYTSVTGECLRICPSSMGIFFDFTGHVEVLSSDFALTCDHLTLQSVEEKPVFILSEPLGGTRIRNVKTDGNVFVSHGKQTFQADRGEIFPEEGILVLTGNVSIDDTVDIVTGEKFIIRDGKKRDLCQIQEGKDCSVAFP